MTMTELRQNTVIGTRLLRREDPALLTGEAKFTSDLNIPGALHLAVLRSPHAHATITSINSKAAAALPGVVAVYTGTDLQSMWAGPMPCAWPVTADMKSPQHFPLAISTVNYVGDGVAAVLATSETASRDALDLIEVNYEVLKPVVDLEEALTDNVLVHDDLGTNKSYTWNLKIEATDGCVDEAFGSVSEELQGVV